MQNLYYKSLAIVVKSFLEPSVPASTALDVEGGQPRQGERVSSEAILIHVGPKTPRDGQHKEDLIHYSNLNSIHLDYI